MSTQNLSTSENVLTSSFYAGTAAAVLGAGLVAGHATLKGRNALLWGSVAGGQCFVLGSTFWFSRSIIKRYLAQEHHLSAETAVNDLISSGIAGSFAGLTGGALRGPRNMLPGAIMLSLMGLSGQATYTGVAALVDSPHERRSILEVLSKSSWWPLKALSDEDYERELTDKIIAIEAEISMIDGKILGLQQKSSEATTTTITDH